MGVGEIFESVSGYVVFGDEIESVGAVDDAGQTLGEASDLFAESFAPNFFVPRVLNEVPVF